MIGIITFNNNHVITPNTASNKPTTIIPIIIITIFTIIPLIGFPLIEKLGPLEYILLSALLYEFSYEFSCELSYEFSYVLLYIVLLILLSYLLALFVFDVIFFAIKRGD